MGFLIGSSVLYEYAVFGYYLVHPSDEHYDMVRRYFAHKDLKKLNKKF